MEKISGLNTLRFLAFVVIFIFHTSPFFKYGYLGVDFFFVLSSFLLTYLAYQEIEITSKFSKLNFFLRRVLRIFPLYYLIIAFSFILLLPLISYLGETPTLPQKKILYWLFLSNYETTDCLFALKFLWSIAVEEQFYLLFLVFSFLLKRHVVLLNVLLLITYITYELIARHFHFDTYTHTVAHFPNFSIGIISGYLYYKRVNVKYYPLLILVLASLSFLIIEGDIAFTINLSLLFASLIFLIIHISEFLKHTYLFRATEYLGVYTYGFYVYSGFVITLVTKSNLIENTMARMLTEFVLLFFIAFLSYHLYEKQFLKLKRYFRPQVSS